MSSISEKIIAFNGAQDIQALLSANPNYAYITFDGNAKKINYVNKNGQIITEPFNPTDASKFISNANTTELGNNIAEQINNFPEKKEELTYNGELFQIKTANPGDIIELPRDVNGHDQIFCVTRKNTPSVNGDGCNQYFDLQTFSNNRVCCYNNSQIIGKHTGDNIKNGHLYHGISSIHCGYPFSINVTGYNRTPLKKYTNQQPSVVLVNYEEHCMYVVPCPLDEHTIGDNCSAHLVAVETNNGIMKCKILPTPVTKLIANTGEYQNEEYQRAIRQINDPPIMVDDNRELDVQEHTQEPEPTINWEAKKEEIMNYYNT